MENYQLSNETITPILDKIDVNFSTSEYCIAVLKESNKVLAFDLEKTRLWAIAAEEELDNAKASVKELLEEINKIKENVKNLIAEKDKATADLAASEAEKAILLEIVNTS
jgi:cell division protein FtsB